MPTIRPYAVQYRPFLQRHDVRQGSLRDGRGQADLVAVIFPIRPAVEKVDVTSRAVQVLILCPTRELAVQVSEEVHKLALFKRGITRCRFTAANPTSASSSGSSRARKSSSARRAA